jgi:hypothetical protein
MSLKHYLWYNPQDQYYYANDSECFDGFVVNAHILAHNAKAFLAYQIEHPKPFFVIPDVHALQFYTDELFISEKGDFRTSWHKLRKAYAGVVDKALAQHRSLDPDDFKSDSDVDAFASSVLDFQRNSLVQPLRALRRLLPTTRSEAPLPEFLVAPHFFFAGAGDRWHHLAIRANQAAVKCKGNEKLYVLIMCPKSCLAQSEVRTILSDFEGDGIDGYLIWIDEFDEFAENEQTLQGLLELVQGLSSTKKPVFNLYGGYFSALLNYYGLYAYASGICTRDKMSAVPQIQSGGPAGGPIPRYYIPELHSKLVQEDAQRLIGQIGSLGCSCQICSSYSPLTMPNKIKPERSALRRVMREHFLHVTARQIGRINSEPAADILTEMSAAASLVANEYPIFDGRYLVRWSNVISLPPAPHG